MSHVWCFRCLLTAAVTGVWGSSPVGVGGGRGLAEAGRAPFAAPGSAPRVGRAQQDPPGPSAPRGSACSLSASRSSASAPAPLPSNSGVQLWPGGAARASQKGHYFVT